MTITMTRYEVEEAATTQLEDGIHTSKDETNALAILVDLRTHEMISDKGFSALPKSAYAFIKELIDCLEDALVTYKNMQNH